MHQQRVTNTYKINTTAQTKAETSAPYTMTYFGINPKKKTHKIFWHLHPDFIRILAIKLNLCFYSFFIGIENQPPQALPAVSSRTILPSASSKQIQGIYIVLMQSINIHTCIYYLFLTRWSWTNFTCIFVFFGQLKNNINTNITKDPKHLQK